MMHIIRARWVEAGDEVKYGGGWEHVYGVVIVPGEHKGKDIASLVLKGTDVRMNADKEVTIRLPERDL